MCIETNAGEQYKRRIGQLADKNRKSFLRTLFVPLLIWLTPAEAADIRSLDVRHHNGLYSMNVEAHLKAPLAAVYAVLTDYLHFEQIAEGITQAHIVDHPQPNVYVVYTRIKGCFLLMCMEKEKTERIKLRSQREVVATIVPEHSDFKSGTTHWNLKTDGDGTTIQLDVRLEPKFWIPPLFGPSIVKSMMRKEGANSTLLVEKLAQQHDGL